MRRLLETITATLGAQSETSACLLIIGMCACHRVLVSACLISAGYRYISSSTMMARSTRLLICNTEHGTQALSALTERLLVLKFQTLTTQSIKVGTKRMVSAPVLWLMMHGCMEISWNSILIFTLFKLKLLRRSGKRCTRQLKFH